ncbi:MAG: hypothetical protein ACJ73D_10265 [Pyrinomonadaceae bacterium]
MTLSGMLIGGATVADAQKKRVVRPKPQAAKTAGAPMANDPQRKAVKGPKAAASEEADPSIGSAVKDKIFADLRTQPACTGQHVKLHLKTVQIAPTKNAFVGACLSASDHLKMAAFYGESGPAGANKILQIYGPGKVSVSKELHNGYHDVIVTSLFGFAGSDTTPIQKDYRWNGRSYAINSDWHGGGVSFPVF